MEPLRRWPGSVGVFAAAFDNFAMTPLLRAIATDLKVDLAETTAVATAYYLAYGLLQVPWGLVSERLGRVTVLRLGLVIGLIGAAVSVLATSLDGLLLGRFISGAGMASVVPAVIAWIGDLLPESERPGAAIDVNSVYAVASASGVVGAGLMADSVGWRYGFAASGALASVGLVASLWLVAPPRPARPGSLGAAVSVAAVRRLAAIALVEGAVLFGLFAFLAPTLLRSGVSARMAGLLIAGYGVSVVVWSRVARRLSGKVSPIRGMAVGGGLLVVSWAVVALAPGPVGVLFASVAMGATIVFFHSQLQVWATQAAPASRGPAIALFSGSLFVGASIGSRLAKPLFESGQLGLMFGLGALGALVVVVPAVLGRRSALRVGV